MNLTTAGSWDAADETGYPDPDLYETDDATDAGGAGAPVDDDEPGYAPAGEDEDADAIEPGFANVVDWVEGWFLPIIRRKITDTAGSGLSWDARWWAYPEVVARLTALHYAWEEARASDQMSAMSGWWIHHLEPHLRVILDGETGPMANADKTGSWMGWPSMPGAPVPAEVLALDVPADDA